MKTIQTEIAQQVLTVTLNRSAAENTLIPELLAELIATFTALKTHDDVAAVVLQSASQNFSIGGDMHGFNRHFPDIRAYAEDIVGKLNQMMLAMIDLPQPVITAVHGAVTGGSMGFVLASDLVLVAPQAVFKAHYPSAGFSPDGGWGVLMPRIAGMRRAAECLLLNRSFNALEAVDWGIANRVVEASELRAEAQRMARKIAAYPAGTMRNSKRLLWQDRDCIAAELESELQKFVAQITRPGAQEGVQRFLQTYKDYPAENPE